MMREPSAGGCTRVICAASKIPGYALPEALELLDREVKNSSLYSYLRDWDTDIDEAKDELDDALAHYMEEIGLENPELADAYLSLPMFREWLTEDLLERNYQDYSFDLRDSIDKNAGQPDTPEWRRKKAGPPLWRRRDGRMCPNVRKLPRMDR